MSATQHEIDGVVALPDARVDPSSTFPSVERLSAPFDPLMILLGGMRSLAYATAAAALAGLCVALLLRPNFTATAVIMPPQAPQSALPSLMGQLGSLSSLSGGASSLLKNPGDLYVGILQSRTIADGAIERFHLQQHWRKKTKVAARKSLEDHVQFEAAKDGLIQIVVKEHDPQLASDLANFFVDALYHMDSMLAISEAGQRRLFFEQQLDQEKAALAKTEEDLKKTQQKTGIITLNGQTELAVRNIAQARAEISAREVELQSLRTYATEQNPDVGRVMAEITTLQGQLSHLESDQSHLAPGDTEVATSLIPQGGLEYARVLREVKYHETLLNLLSRQYEAARIDEAKSAPIIQIVDRAVPPDQKSGPSRALIVLGAAVFGFLLSAGYLLLQAFLRQAETQPATALRLAALRSHAPWLPL
jgi:tyrosine-protein kinase Etk/Wzc